MQLQRNMGFADQVFRTVMGAVLIYMGLFSEQFSNNLLSSILLSSVGVVIIVSSIIGWCPFYHMSGFNTFKSKKDRDWILLHSS